MVVKIIAVLLVALYLSSSVFAQAEEKGPAIPIELAETFTLGLAVPSEYVAAPPAYVRLLSIRAVAQENNPEIQAKIDSAMSAAPLAIAEGATILDLDGTVLREGANEWTCYPDNPVSPGNDPICSDPTWMLLNNAWGSEELPEISVPGVAYMLQGGSDASNTDPLASEPPLGEDWIATPPHIMILPVTGTDLSALPTDHHYGGPYVMWAGTPYQHIMIPVAMEHPHS